MTTLSEELSKAIQSQLPQMLSQELQARLKEGDDAVAKLTSAKASNELIQRQLDDSAKKVLELTKQVQQHVALDVREKAIADREHKLDLEIMQIKLDCAQGNINYTQGLMNSLVRNTEFRQTVYETIRNKSHAVDGHPGGNGSYPSPGFVANSTQEESTSKTQTGVII